MTYFLDYDRRLCNGVEADIQVEMRNTKSQLSSQTIGYASLLIRESLRVYINHLLPVPLMAPIMNTHSVTPNLCRQRPTGLDK